MNVIKNPAMVIVIFVLLMFTNSCTNENSSLNEPSPKNLKAVMTFDAFSSMGSVHNQKLDSILLMLQKSQNKNSELTEDYLQENLNSYYEIIHDCLNYYQEKDTTEDYDVAEDYYAAEFYEVAESLTSIEDLYNYLTEIQRFEIEDFPIISRINNEISMMVSMRYPDIDSLEVDNYEELVDVYSDAQRRQLQDSYELYVDINEEENNYSKIQMDAINNYISVCAYSASYWNNPINQYNWSLLFVDSPNQNVPMNSPKKVLKWIKKIANAICDTFKNKDDGTTIAAYDAAGGLILGAGGAAVCSSISLICIINGHCDHGNDDK